MSPQTRSILIVVASVIVGALLALGGTQLIKSQRDDEVVQERRREVSSIIATAEPIERAEPVSPSEATEDAGESAASASDSGDGCGRPALFTKMGLLPPTGLSGSFPAYVPTRYDPDKRHVVLMLFHDDTQDAAEFLEISGFVEIAERLEIIAIAPQDRDVLAWSKREEASVARDALQAASEALCVDPSRVYAVGFGAGGRIVEEMPCIMEVAGIATASYRSTAKDTVCFPPNPVPYIHLAPLKDGYSPPEGGEGCGGLHEPISLDEKEKMWRARNQCTSGRRTWLKQDGTKCFSWPCDANFASCHVDGGRGWPGTKRRIFDIKKCDGKPADFPYAKTIWQFFARGPTE